MLTPSTLLTTNINKVLVTITGLVYNTDFKLTLSQLDANNIEITISLLKNLISLNSGVTVLFAFNLVSGTDHNAN